MSRILLSCPVSDYKSYVLHEWLAMVEQLYGDFDIYLVDNSDTPALYRQLYSEKWWVDHIPGRKRTTHDLIAASWNKIRKVVLQDGYEWHFMLECDVFPPKDIIYRLLANALAYQSAISAATYLVFRGERAKPMVDNFYAIPGYGNLLVVNHPGATACSLTGQAMTAHAFGQGCALVHRSVYEKGISFRYVPGHAGHADIFFAADLADRNITAIVDSNIICRHANQDWTFIAKDKHQLI